MKRLINASIFVLCLLPLIEAAANCEMEQTSYSFSGDNENPRRGWICPGGKLVIDLEDYPHQTLNENMSVSVKDRSTQEVNLTISKYDPGPNQQIQLRINHYDIWDVDITKRPGDFHFPDIIIGDTKGKFNSRLNGEQPFTRKLTITNKSRSDICLVGTSPNSKCE